MRVVGRVALEGGVPRGGTRFSRAGTAAELERRGPGESTPAAALVKIKLGNRGEKFNF